MPQASSHSDFTSSCRRRAYPDRHGDQIKVVAMLPAAAINVKKISEEFMGEGLVAAESGRSLSNSACAKS